MFGSRRPGKRSIVGTRVCALFHDGLYRPGIIQSVHISALQQTVPQTYTVTFDEGGGTNVFTDDQLIGPGFQSLSKSNLNIGQTVYITHNNREVKGQILGSSGLDLNGCNAPKYWLVGIGDELDAQVKVKFDDIRLLESRKSARLSDQDTDYVKMADLPFQESKKRTNLIDVPDFSAKQCKSNHVYAKREDLHLSRDIEMEVMDENMAAMVLTSLSCSPVSPRIVGNFNEISHLTNGSIPPHQGESEGVNSNSTLTQCSGSSSPSDSLLSQSAPSNVFSFSLNEDKQFARFGFSRTVYQCTWPGCKQIYNTCPGIEKHIRIEHLGPQNVSDHEEDFYYSEIEVMMDSRHNDSPTSPTSHNFFNPTSDHNYQRKEASNMPITIPDRPTATGAHHGHPAATTNPAKDFNLSSSLPWNMPEQAFTYAESNGIPISNGFSKSFGQKKPRAEVKKCRKVYGLENRSSWCTQCKWKKACTRFHERSSEGIS